MLSQGPGPERQVPREKAGGVYEATPSWFGFGFEPLLEGR